ncbi:MULTISPECIES: VCBS repeat-containing protein [unclassified Rhizobium]|uniref:FG-GAP repeat domain-containing protein n=1 Tax=unclassified Rhizobium TaxID=2613769 RepID=UPI002B261E40|nr:MULTISPECIES: VCBS repeat-containing protein [unclassified Rhizobium]
MGRLAPAFGTFGTNQQHIVAGEFWNILHIARQREDGTFEPTSLVRGVDDAVLELDHCIHLPCVVDWDGDGREDILYGAEDGYISFLKNVGDGEDGLPRFEQRGRIETTKPLIHAGILPSPAAYDFSGDGHYDLVVGNSTGELLFYQSREKDGTIFLDKEVMLKGGDTPIRIAAGLMGSIQGPSEKMFGYSCPTLADWTGNGSMDILVSDVTGHHRLFRNTGQKVLPPRFGEEEFLTFNGKPLKTVWRVRPAVVDWLNDSDLHYIALDEDGVLSDWRKASDTEARRQTFPSLGKWRSNALYGRCRRRSRSREAMLLRLGGVRSYRSDFWDPCSRLRAAGSKDRRTTQYNKAGRPVLLPQCRHTGRAAV